MQPRRIHPTESGGNYADSKEKRDESQPKLSLVSPTLGASLMGDWICNYGHRSRSMVVVPGSSPSLSFFGS